MSSIVIYFSRAGENYFGGELKNIEKGNTEVIAEYIHELDNADLFKVEPAVEYPADYMKCTDLAKKEQKDNARPEIKETLDNLKESGIEVIGRTPCLSEFVEDYDGRPTIWKEDSGKKSSMQ